MPGLAPPMVGGEGRRPCGQLRLRNLLTAAPNPQGPGTQLRPSSELTPAAASAREAPLSMDTCALQPWPVPCTLLVDPRSRA